MDCVFVTYVILLLGPVHPVLSLGVSWAAVIKAVLNGKLYSTTKQTSLKHFQSQHMFLDTVSYIREIQTINHAPKPNPNLITYYLFCVCCLRIIIWESLGLYLLQSINIWKIRWKYVFGEKSHHTPQDIGVEINNEYELKVQTKGLAERHQRGEPASWWCL